MGVFISYFMTWKTLVCILEAAWILIVVVNNNINTCIKKHSMEYCVWVNVWCVTAIELRETHGGLFTHLEDTCSDPSGLVDGRSFSIKKYSHCTEKGDRSDPHMATVRTPFRDWAPSPDRDTSQSPWMSHNLLLNFFGTKLTLTHAEIYQLILLWRRFFSWIIPHSYP